ncbi:M24 family metallopeptidase [Algicella marina]|nr:Xaa-Pro peptidase family protein [Algicella marina]
MLHFSEAEFARRRAALDAERRARGLDALLIFAQESMYWLTGYDTFGFCFFQCLIITEADSVLLTRSADLRQAQLTSNIADIRIWPDGADANPAEDLVRLLSELGLHGKRLGVEFDTHGLTAHNYRRLTAAIDRKSELIDASDLVSTLRLVKSEEEIACVRKAAELADTALDVAVATIRPGISEAEVLAAMQAAVLRGGGDYPGNPFIIGSGDHALLCRYSSGRQAIRTQDQVTLEWAGVWRQYHAAMMATPIVGEPTDRQKLLHAAAEEALLACEDTLHPGATMGDVFSAHARTLDAHGLAAHRLKACGYALGTRYAPSWMEHQMFYEDAPTVIRPGMVFFLHMILMDSESGNAMTLGRTSLVGEVGSQPLSGHDTALIVI